MKKTEIEADSIAPLFTTDGVEVTKGMDVYVVEGYGTQAKAVCRWIIALSRIRRYVIMRDESGDEIKNVITDNEGEDFFSSVEKAKRKIQANMLNDITAKRNMVA